MLCKNILILAKLYVVRFISCPKKPIITFSLPKILADCNNNDAEPSIPRDKKIINNDDHKINDHKNKPTIKRALQSDFQAMLDILEEENPGIYHFRMT